MYTSRSYTRGPEMKANCTRCLNLLTSTAPGLCATCNALDPQPGPLDRSTSTSLHPITAALMRDDGGEVPAFCVVAAYRTEDEARAALARIGGGL